MKKKLHSKKRPFVYKLLLAISAFILLDNILHADNSFRKTFDESPFKSKINKIDTTHIVYGQVYDSISKKPIADVKVYFRGSADTATTTEYSGYRLWMQDNLLRSEQTLVFQHKNYMTKEIVIMTINYPISLDMNLLKLNMTKKRSKKNKKGSH